MIGQTDSEVGISACVPCDNVYGGAVCTLFSPAKYFKSAICEGGIAGVDELNTSHVCILCNPFLSIIDASSSSSMVAVGLEAGSAAWNDWLTKRKELIAGSSSEDWGTINCRFAGYH